MNTDLDSPLVVWLGRIMCFIGIYGVLLPIIFFTTGVSIFPGFDREDGILGLGAMIAAIFGGIGGAFVLKTRRQKLLNKERKKTSDFLPPP